MTKKQGISIGIIAAILTGVFMYAVYYFPYVLAECMFQVVCVSFCFGGFYLIVALIYPFDPDIEEKMKIQEEMKKENKK